MVSVVGGRSQVVVVAVGQVVAVWACVSGGGGHPDENDGSAAQARSVVVAPVRVGGDGDVVKRGGGTVE